MKEQDLQALESAARLIITVIERARIEEENRGERIRDFTMYVNEKFGTLRTGSTSPMQENGERDALLQEKEKPTVEVGKNGILKFNEKELQKMPKKIRLAFGTGKINAHVRKKTNGVYEIRCQINYQQVYASSKRLDAAKQKFIVSLYNLEKERLAELNKERPVSLQRRKRFTLGEYMLQWLETVKKPVVKASTYKDYLLNYNVHIQRSLGNYAIKDISPFELQKFLNTFVEQGKNRTANKLRQLLYSLFDYAVVDDILYKNPMQKVVLPRYEEKHGEPLTRAEEKELVRSLRNGGNVYVQTAVFFIYTGIRRSELASVTIQDGWIHLTTSKQRKGLKEKSRALPICPMLAPLLPFIDLQAMQATPLALLTKYFKQLLPNHHLHDTRHTFITRAQECGIARELVSFWAGHAADSSMTSTVYTHFGQSLDYQMESMSKFSYDL